MESGRFKLVFCCFYLSPCVKSNISPVGEADSLICLVMSSMTTVSRQEVIRSSPCEYRGWKVARQVAAMSEKKAQSFPRSMTISPQRQMNKRLPIRHPDLSSLLHTAEMETRQTSVQFDISDSDQLEIRPVRVCGGWTRSLLNPFTADMMACGDLGGTSCHQGMEKTNYTSFCF